MGKRFLAAAVFSALLAVGSYAQQIEESGQSISRRSRVLGHGSKSESEALTDGSARLRACERAKAMPVAPGFDRAWRSLGPRPTVVLDSASGGGPPIASGRVTSVAVHPDFEGSVVYLGSARGGVWKTENAGQTWTPLTDFEPTLAIGSLAIDPSHPDTVYAGTGEEDFDDLEAYFGTGILKTTNGGKTWRLLGTTEFAGLHRNTPAGSHIGALAVDPRDGRILLAGVSGIDRSHSGIYRSADAGESWRLVLKGAPGTAVVFDPVRPATVYAGIGGKMIYDPMQTLAGSGIYKSTDGGRTWAKSANGIPDHDGRIALAIGGGNIAQRNPAKPPVLYAAIAGKEDAGPLGVFKSSDGAQTWTSANGPEYCSGTCWWSNTIAASPDDPDIVLVAGLQTFMTRNGGKEWLTVTNGSNGNLIHWDVHAMAFDRAGNRLYVGTDGGIYRGDNIGITMIRELGWTNINDTLSLTQFYPGCSVEQNESDFILCGTQDNGTQMYSGGVTWRMVAGGDGGFTAVDSSRPAVFYFSAAGQVSIYKSSPFTTFNGFLPVVSGLQDVDADDCFVPPLIIDPAFPQRLYFGCRRVYRTDDGGGHWRPISDALPRDESYTYLTISPADSSRIYAATTGGHILRLSQKPSGGMSWVQSTGLPERGISWVAVDPRAPDTVYATAIGFSHTNDNRGHIFKTLDGGTTWNDISGNMPNIPVNTILPDSIVPGRLFVGTDLGVFVTTNGGVSWAKVGHGLPLAPVTGLSLRSQGRILRAATHGRGMWELTAAAHAGAPLLHLKSATKDGRLVRITGNGFTTHSVVRWNGAARETTFVDRNTLEISSLLGDSLIGRVTLSVRDSLTGAVSNSIDLATNMSPVIDGIGNAALNLAAGDAAPLSACPADSGVSLAPGMLARIRGQNLSPNEMTLSPSEIGQTLGGAIVEFRSTKLHVSYVAPIVSVSASQIDFVVPSDVPLGSGLQLDVVQSNHMSQKLCVTIVRFNPGLFSGNGIQASATFVSDGKSVGASNSKDSRPAKKGERIRLLATGLGPYWQEPGNGPFETIAMPHVEIGGKEAQVVASEAPRQFAGTYIVTVEIPADVSSGLAVSVQLKAGGAVSNTVAIAVQ